MLKDLNKVILECQQKWSTLPNYKEIRLDQLFKALLNKHATEYFKQTNKKETHLCINDYSIIYTNNENLRANFSTTCLYYAYAFAPFLEELEKYKNEFDNIINNISKNKQLTPEDKNNKDKFLGKLPCENWENLPEANDWVDDINKEFNSLNDNDRKYLSYFISNPKWWIKSTKISKGKKLNRSDVIQSALLCAMNVIHASSDKIYEIVKICLNPELKEALKNLIDKNEIDIGRNIIFYGAPGTGKSYQIDQLTKGGNCIHTVFHADTQYSDFLGMLKPTMNDNNECSYHFMPGPFIQSYVNALKNPQIHHYLVIEEINRAQAAMVFGEIFQLLDRDENGVGYYEIESADQSLVEYLINQIGGYPDNKVKLQMPGNLSILATMNSSDQAVMPLDTAFKRRWEFEYIQINMDKASDKIINIPNNNQTVGVAWRKLATEINERLSEFNIPEDRHLGPFFLSTNEINEKGLTNKLFIYLWDDLLRHQAKTIIFDSGIRTFGQLIKCFQEKNDIFCPELQQKLF